MIRVVRLGCTDRVSFKFREAVVEERRFLAVVYDGDRELARFTNKSIVSVGGRMIRAPFAEDHELLDTLTKEAANV